ncbi:MAG: sulfurtransferase [bacterium]|nr:sulfurtransferase [bacterium]
MESIRPSELAERLQRGDKLVLLDVRRHNELEICVLPNVVHLPLSDLDQGHHILDPDDVIVCICHHGIRSAQACTMLESYGFDGVINLTGGMELWAQEMDPEMARY